MKPPAIFAAVKIVIQLRQTPKMLRMFFGLAPVWMLALTEAAAPLAFRFRDCGLHDCSLSQRVFLIQRQPSPLAISAVAFPLDPRRRIRSQGIVRVLMFQEYGHGQQRYGVARLV
jgi:hypothetical protein